MFAIFFIKSHDLLLQLHSDEDESGAHNGAEPTTDPTAPGCSAKIQPMWVNSLVGRIFWDFLQEKYWSDQVAQKIQKKLGKIKVRICVKTTSSFPSLTHNTSATCLPK